MATQVQMQVASANIANADTDGYTRKTASTTAVVSGGSVGGISVTAISSNVDQYLLRNVMASTSELASATAINSLSDSLQTLYGTVSGSDESGTSLANTLASLETALTNLGGTVESSSLQSLTIDALDNLATQLRETSSGIQSLRSDADGKIDDAVDTANAAIQTIDALNSQILSLKAQGVSTSDLEDQRNSALKTLAGLLDVSYVVNDAGLMQVSTSSGTTLVGSSAHTLSYTASGSVAAGTSFSAIAVDGIDITSQISSGTIGGLIEMRDVVLPDAQAGLDELAEALATTLNGLYNSGTSLPASSTLTGTTAVAAGDSLSATGTLRIALVDADGALSSYTDLDLSSYATVGDLADALDALDGISASVSDGHLQIASDDSSLGLSLADIDAAIGADGDGASAYFGLNDLLTGSSAATIAVRSDLLSGDTALAVGTLDTADTLTVGNTVLGSSASFVATLTDAMSDDVTFAAAGTQAATSTSLASYAASLVSSVASQASSASTAETTRQDLYDSYADALSSASGVNVDEESAIVSQLEQQYSVAAQLLEVLNSMFDALLSAAKA